MITVYTTSHCPQCQMLKSRLAQLGIPFETIDDEDKLRKMGICSVPVMDVDGTQMNLREALAYLNER